MAAGASLELQEIALVAMAKDPYIFSKCMETVDESYFNNPSFKFIYRCIRIFYKKYMVLPNLNEMKLLIRENFIKDYGEVEDIMMTAEKIFNQDISSDKFISEKVTEFIRRVNIEKVLWDTVNAIESNGSEKGLDLDKIADRLSNGISISFNRSHVYNLADVSKVQEIREESMGSSDNPVRLKVFIDALNPLMQYGALTVGTLNMVVAPPGRGKTTFLINQGVSTARQGYKLLHIFLGDMSARDGQLRYLSCYTGVPTKALVDLTDSELIKFIQKHNATGFLANIDIASYAADALTANQLMEEIMAIQKEKRRHYDALIIDYDENIASDESNIYLSGGDIYNKLALFSISNKSVVFIASQPKPEYWKNEILPLECASESSKKQKIIDLMLTIGKPSKGSSVGSLHIAKNRRGEDCRTFRLNINGSNAVITHITEDEYNRAKQGERNAQ